MIGKVATANLLRGGEIVYFAASGDWSEDLQDAKIVYDEIKNETCLYSI